MRTAGKRTKRATVEAGLRLLVQTRGQARMRGLRGKIQWQGDLDASRLGHGAKDLCGRGKTNASAVLSDLGGTYPTGSGQVGR